MKKKYEGVIVLNAQGKEENVEDMISRIGKEMEAEGVKLEQIDQIGKRDFAYESKHQSSGFFVNYQFEADPSSIDKLRTRLALIDEVHLQHYQKA